MYKFGWMYGLCKKKRYRELLKVLLTQSTMTGVAWPEIRWYILKMPILTRQSEATMRGGQRVFRLQTPFTIDELQRITLVGDRLKHELVSLIERIPKKKESALNLARDIGVDRNITQKIASGLAAGVQGPLVCAYLPGPERLRTFLEASKRLLPDAAGVDGAMAAVALFTAAIADLGGSHAKLIDRINSWHESNAGQRNGQPVVGKVSGGDSELAVRRRLFCDMSSLLRVSSEVMVTIAAVRPKPGHAQVIEFVTGCAMVGLRWEGGTRLPFRTQASSYADHAVASKIAAHPGLANEQQGFDVELLPDLCSKPTPVLHTETRDGLTQVTVEPIELSTTSPRREESRVDMAWIQTPSVHLNPLLLNPEDRGVWSRMNTPKTPTMRGVYDVYLHKSLAMSCVPTAGMFRWFPGMPQDPAKLWHERMPGHTRLELLGRGLKNAPSDAWEKHALLAQTVFEAVGDPPDEYIGYRYDIAYPLWNTTCIMAFDFRV